MSDQEFVIPEGMVKCPNQECRYGLVSVRVPATHDWSMSNNPSASDHYSFADEVCSTCRGHGYISIEVLERFLKTEREAEREREAIAYWESVYTSSIWSHVETFLNIIGIPISFVFAILTISIFISKFEIAGISSDSLWFTFLILGFSIIGLSFLAKKCEEVIKRKYLESHINN